MRLIKNTLGLILLLAFSLTSCKKDINVFDATQITTPYAGKAVNANFNGEVVDEAGEPIEGVGITIGTKEAKTDKNGIFIIREALVSENQAYIKADKGGYFHGSRSMVVEENGTHFVKIQLLDNTPVDAFGSTEGGTIIENGVELVFPPNSVAVNNPGDDVQVALKYLDPSSNEVYDQMPGDLTGIRTDGSEAALATFGMIAVELTGPSGEKLQVADGFEVDVKIPLPASIVGMAPQTIPLWHFDEVEGTWKEEGQAELQGDFYVGKVSHFSYWNCDAPFPLVYMEGRVVDEDGSPIANIMVELKIVGERFSRRGFTNGNGVFAGKVPKDQALEIAVIGTNSCAGETFYQEDIGSFSDDFMLADIVLILDASVKNLKFSGRLVNCDGDPIENGYIKGKFDTKSFVGYVEADGTFEFSSLLCGGSSDITLKGYDVEGLKESNEINQTVADDFSFGDVFACTDLDVYITYELDGNAPVLFADHKGIQPVNQTVIAFQIDSTGNRNQGIYMSIDVVDQEGTFLIADSTNPDFFNFYVEDLFELVNETVSITFTQYDTFVDGYIIGTFGGDFKEQNGTSHTITGTFRMQRK